MKEPLYRIGCPKHGIVALTVVARGKPGQFSIVKCEAAKCRYFGRTRAVYVTRLTGPSTKLRGSDAVLAGEFGHQHRLLYQLRATDVARWTRDLLGTLRRNWMIVTGLITLFVPAPPPPALPVEAQTAQVAGARGDAGRFPLRAGHMGANDPNPLTLGDVQQLTQLSGSQLRRVALSYQNDPLVYKTSYQGVDWQSSNCRLGADQFSGLMFAVQADATYANRYAQWTDFTRAELATKGPSADPVSEVVKFAFDHQLTSTQFEELTIAMGGIQANQSGTEFATMSDQLLTTLHEEIVQGAVPAAAQSEPTQFIYVTPPTTEFEVDLKNALQAIAPLAATKSPNAMPPKGEFEADIKTDRFELDVKGSTKDLAAPLLVGGTGRAVVARAKARKQRKSKPARTRDEPQE